MSFEDKAQCPYHKNIAIQQASNLNDNKTDEAIALEQSTWHKKGNNGCIFSQIIAQSPEDYAWQSSIVSELSNHSAEEIDYLVKQAIENPTVRLLSLIFPSVTTQEELVKLVEILAYESSSILLLNDESLNGLAALAFRTSLEDDTVLAWIMGFGPHETFAKTRQAPYTELVIPVKPKPDNTYHRHNQDKSTAHVADQHIDLDDKVLDRLWHNTFTKTRKVLGHEPDVFSGARTTFTITEDEWLKIKR
jgi:hypothetical protein